jgi:hypothetical protein
MRTVRDKLVVNVLSAHAPDKGDVRVTYGQSTPERSVYWV